MPTPYDTTKDFEDNTILNFFKYVNYELDTAYDTNILNKQFTLSNLYIYKKYKSINYILLLIIILCIVIIFLTALNKNVDYFDDNSYISIISIILVFSILYISYLVFDVYNRTNINYDEYNFNTKNNKNPLEENTKKKDYATIDISNVDSNKCIKPDI